jgi:hypothetical protein
MARSASTGTAELHVTRLHAAALLLLFASCALDRPRPLPGQASRAPFRVQAEDQESAERVLEHAGQALAAAQRLPGMRARSEIVIRVRGAGSTAAQGSTRWRGDPARREEAWIELALGPDTDEQLFLLGHELAHALFDETWQRLPQIVEEGLADHAGQAASPDCGARRRLAHAIRLCSWLGPGLAITQSGQEPRTLFARLDLESLPEPERMLELDGRSYHEVKPAENRELLYAFGYLIVERIGVAKLREMCAAAQARGEQKLAPAELLEAARLDPREKRSWTGAIEALVGAPELEALRREPATR